MLKLMESTPNSC